MSDGSPPSFVICSFVCSFLPAGCILGRVCGPNESRDQRSRQCAIRRRHSHFKLHQEVVYAHPSVGTWPMLSAGVACAPVPSRLAHVGHRRTGEAGEEAGLQGATSSSTRWPSPWAPRNFPMYAPGHRAHEALLRRSDPIARSRSRCRVVQAFHGHASVLRSRAP